jgi:hypothetical protein
MHSADLQLTIAEVSVAVAGFSAVVVTLNAKPVRAWDETDRLNLRLLIQVAFLTILFALLPSILDVSLEPDALWSVALWAYGLVHLLDVGSFLMGMTKHTPRVFLGTACCGVAVALTQIAVAWAGSTTARETTYVASLVWHLYVTFLAFVLLLYGIRKAS